METEPAPADEKPDDDRAVSTERDRLPGQPIRIRNSGFRNTYRLSIKELKEILRDRRTIITLIAMPILIYPLLSILLQKFYLASAASPEKVAYKFVIDHEVVNSSGDSIESLDGIQLPRDEQLIDLFRAQFINLGEAFAFEELEFPPKSIVKPLDKESLAPGFVRSFEYRYFEDNSIAARKNDDAALEEMVEKGEADVGIRLIRNPRGLSVQIVQSKSGVSANAANYLRKRIDYTNQVLAQLRLARAGISWSGRPYQIVSVDGNPPSSAISMASLVPLILILMTVTGAVYPAIDLTAGERERGTLEALIAAPVPRFQVLFAKFVGVLTVAMLTAVVNMLAMFSTLALFGLLPMLFGDGSFGWFSILQIFGLLILFAGFFSAVLLAVTSFARSFKEAQAYIVPVTLLAITPGIISLSPGLELTGVMTVIPLLNIVLLAREILEGNASSLPAIVAITSTALYGVAALSAAANVFGSDSILYGSQSSWKSLVKRPNESSGQVSLSRAFSCLAMLFPLSFIGIALVGRVPQWIADQRGIAVEEVPYWYQLFPFVVSTVVVFVLVPSLFLWHGRIRFVDALGLRWGRPAAYLSALLIGISMWPLIGQMVEYFNQLSDFLSGHPDQPDWKTELLDKAKQIVERWRTISPVVIVFCFSIVPAVCEEFFFRGVLLRSIAMRNRMWLSVFLSAFVFGIFHTLSLTDLSSQKFLPSFLAGLFLAWLALKSGSLLPGILLHSLNNGILVSLAYYEDRLQAAGWIDETQNGFPFWALALALIGMGAGVLLLAVWVKPETKKIRPDHLDQPSQDKDL